jgi:ArsR family transcriptional regulator
MLVEKPDNTSARIEQPTVIESLESLMKAAADRLRLEILQVLNQDSFGVLELCTIFAIKQSGMSHHLKVLANAGLVCTRREGNSIYYRRPLQSRYSKLNRLQQALFATVDQLTLPPEVLSGIAEVQKSRAISSQRFFSENADKFRAQQDLIASYEHYADGVKTLLGSVPVPAMDLAIEIGPGEGAFLAELSQRFKQVIAIDNSAEMLNKAHEFVKTHTLDNIELLHGDTREAVKRSLQADCIAINMVLHHTPSPADIFQDLAACLKPQGALLVCDLCQHDQGWVRDSCGDLWLGFDPDDISRWASKAGLSAGQDMYLALRNGFRIQIRHFFKH